RSVPRGTLLITLMYVQNGRRALVACGYMKWEILRFPMEGWISTGSDGASGECETVWSGEEEFVCSRACEYAEFFKNSCIEWISCYRPFQELANLRPPHAV